MSRFRALSRLVKRQRLSPKWHILRAKARRKVMIRRMTNDIQYFVEKLSRGLLPSEFPFLVQVTAREDTKKVTVTR